MSADAFQPSPSAFQRNAFQFGGAGAASSTSEERIPRWLLKCERAGRTTYLSDVGGDVEDQFYIPAVVDVSLSAQQIDLERFTIPKASCTVHISPSALQEHFLSLDDLGRAKVTVYRWNGQTANAVITADMEFEEWGYDGEPTSFRLTEDFRHNPVVPEKLVNYGPGQGFTKAQLASGARFRAYTWAWGSAKQVPAFALLDAGGGNTRYMIVGHNLTHGLPTGGDGIPARFRDLTNATYIAVDLASAPSFGFYDVDRSWDVVTAADFVRALVERHSGYEDDELDGPGLSALYEHLKAFPAAGYATQEGPLFSLVQQRLQTEYMFVMYQQGGKLTGCGINPTAEPARTLVFGVHLLQLQTPVQEQTKYTAFKVRYKFRQKPDTGWYGVDDLGQWNSPYLKALTDRWGYRSFGNPVEFPRHASSVDLADVEDPAAAKTVLHRYAQLFHRGQHASYLMLSEFDEIPLGTVVALVDSERGYDEKPAVLIGRQYLTPELIVHTFRTIEPFEQHEVPGETIAGASAFNLAPSIQGGAACWGTASGSSAPTYDFSTGKVTIAAGQGASSLSCPVTPGQVVDYGAHIKHISGGSGVNEKFFIQLWGDTGPSTTTFLIHEIGAFLRDEGDPGGGWETDCYFAGSNPLGATRVWLVIRENTGATIEASAPFLWTRNSSDPDPWNGATGGCMFPTHAGQYCPNLSP